MVAQSTNEPIWKPNHILVIGFLSQTLPFFTTIIVRLCGKRLPSLQAKEVGGGNPHNFGRWMSTLICLLLMLSQESGQTHGLGAMPTTIQRKVPPEHLFGWGGCCLKGVWDASWDARGSQKHWGEMMGHRCLVPATGAGEGLYANVIADEYQAGLVGKWNK